jgi:predicted nucleotidyltransferase
VTRLFAALLHVVSDLEDLNQKWALVGGLAVSAWSEPRTTRDIDLVVAVENDKNAERLVRDLVARGYQSLEHLEQDATGRLATVRLVVPGEGEGGIVVDLLFASSGLEPEIVDAAAPVEIAPGVTVPLARLSHLLALKILAGRFQDLTDLQNLLAQATPADLQHARESLLLISSRGFNRKKDLLTEFSKVVAELG